MGSGRKQSTCDMEISHFLPKLHQKRTESIHLFTRTIGFQGFLAFCFSLFFVFFSGRFRLSKSLRGKFGRRRHAEYQAMYRESDHQEAWKPKIVEVKPRKSKNQVFPLGYWGNSVHGSSQKLFFVWSWTSRAKTSLS